MSGSLPQVLPEAPEKLVSELSRRYIWLYQAITGQDFQPALVDVPPNERMKKNLSSAMLRPPSPDRCSQPRLLASDGSIDQEDTQLLP